MPAVELLRWTAHRPPVVAGTRPVATLSYTAPGGWAIVWDEERRRTAGTPWKLCRHGHLMAYCHTLRIARLKANQTVLAERVESARDG